MQQPLLEVPPVPRRKPPRRDPAPRFKPDHVRQLDPLVGCPDLQVPPKHLAREIRDLLARIDTSSLESKYSSLGRHGFHPRHVLGVLIYGSLIGIHHSTKLERISETDAAFRLVAGGNWISAGKLREFRRTHRAFFQDAIAQTLRMAVELKLLDAKQLAVDSVRLRAHASTKAARTLKRSKARLEELAKIDTATLSDVERADVEEKKSKHRQAVAECLRLDRTNIVVTSPSAGLLKFPNGASAPGHRMTVMACGVKARLIVDVLVDAASNDFGKLRGAVERGRAVLSRVGVDTAGMQVAADAGFWCEEDLAYAAENRDQVDVLIAQRRESRRRDDANELYFTPDQFIVGADQSVICPAGNKMRGPYREEEATRYQGVGCEICPLKAKCTRAKRRHLTLRPKLHAYQNSMTKRLAEPGAVARYGQRMATVEPVFAGLQDAMAFRRTSSRTESAVLAELMLKVLAYNISRLLAARRLQRVRIAIAFSSTL